jgi:phage tail protein X
VFDAFSAPANKSATGTACPSGSAPAAGFTDTDLVDVDCIKMYGITQGTTATTYEPDGSIPRWQMALFLNRMFVPMGIAAAGTTVVPDFTDTAGLSAEINAAITAIASHGITVGTSATTFGPDDNVTREQMALFLYRLGNITKHYNAATVTARGIWHDTLANDFAIGTYNYSDINTLQLESMEAIASLYNAGVTGETCLANGNAAAPTGGCASTYRPGDDMTRAEMAAMIVAQMGRTNARPAGLTMQAPEGLATAGGKTIQISVRGADFTPTANVSVDHFYDPVQLTTLAALAANARFTAVLNTVSASVTSAVGTAGTIDALDLKTGALGNVAGTGQTTLANSTTAWYAWTAPAGTVFLNGSTADVATLEAVHGAGSTTVYGDKVTYSISGSNLLGKALPLDYSQTTPVVITADDGIQTVAGGSRTLTATMSNAALTTAGTAHVVTDGYTFKFADKKIDQLGQATITNTYVASSGGAASYTVTCGADPLPATNAAAKTSSSYWESNTK